MKVAILGTRGIPNYHGGFEQFAEFFSVFLVNNGHDVYVYNSHNHPYQEHTFNGVNIIHCKDYEVKIGTIGQFLYDLNCIRDAQSRHFDIILQLGYTSNSIWHRQLPKSTIIITNMDGLEWKRTKYSKAVRRFLKFAEKLAVKSSDYLISDSIGIQNYLKDTYQKSSTFIPYGANLFNNPNSQTLEEYNVTPYNYNLLIARMEPENNIETILEGAVMANIKETFLVIGKHDDNKFGAYLKNKHRNNHNIIFVGGIYNLNHLDNLRYFSRLYFHGHSVGGTNPSLLEAMASNALIIAHDNIFNRGILGNDAFYFKTSLDIRNVLNDLNKEKQQDIIGNNRHKIQNIYSWEKINHAYLALMQSVFKV